MIIDFGDNIPMYNHNIPMKIPHSNGKLYYILMQSCNTLLEVVLGSSSHTGNATCNNVSYSGPLI